MYMLDSLIIFVRLEVDVVVLNTFLILFFATLFSRPHSMTGSLLLLVVVFYKCKTFSCSACYRAIFYERKKGP